MTLTISVFLLLCRFFVRSFSPWFILSFLALFPFFSLFDIKVLGFLSGELTKEFWLLTAAAEVFFLTGLYEAIKQKLFSETQPLLALSLGLSSIFTAEGLLLAAALPAVLEYYKAFKENKDLNPYPYFLGLGLIVLWKTSGALEENVVQVLTLLLVLLLIARLNSLSLISALPVSLFGAFLEPRLGVFFWTFIFILICLTGVFIGKIQVVFNEIVKSSKTLERLVIWKTIKKNRLLAVETFDADLPNKTNSNPPSLRWRLQENSKLSLAGIGICLFFVLLGALWWGQNV